MPKTGKSTLKTKLKIDLGCGNKCEKGFVGMDKRKLKGVKIVHDLEKIPYPLEDNSVDELLARHTVEHLEQKKIIDIFNEWWRILKPGKQLTIITPEGSTSLYRRDLTHLHPWDFTTPRYLDPAFFLYDTYQPKPWEIISNELDEKGMLYFRMKKGATKDPRICLLVVESRDYLLKEYVRWIMRNKFYRVLFWTSDKAPIWYLRQNLIRTALTTGCTHVLFIDTDVIPPENFIKELLARKKDMVSGIYHIFTGVPCSQKDGKYYQGKGLEEVDVCSMGASLIRREVLERVPYPKPDDHSMDADVKFCKAVKKAGFKIFQDFDLKCVHIQTVPIINK